jgi:hypothetical protein
MHFWVIYQPGVGGHGFSNCLEHANNITPVDNCLEWRIHYRPNRYGILDRPVKFYSGDNTVNSILINHTKGNHLHTVFSGHPWVLSDDKKILQENTLDRVEFLSKFNYNILIHLYSSDSLRVLNDFNAKMPFMLPDNYKNSYSELTNRMIKMSEFAVHIDIERAWRDWDYLTQSLNLLGIDLDKKYYDQYLNYIDL